MDAAYVARQRPKVPRPEFPVLNSLPGDLLAVVRNEREIRFTSRAND
jgi:hypothetical protein